ncbi:DUF4232 domain-containing protein [Streptomyces sp. NPDC060194]|uniref:DUF4232 domain-containing protein n=1 Tax=Streptomyces sp. NPDC060194 TaxID=3347069 RepID=UPI003652A345
MRVRTLTFTALAVAAALSVTGCQGGEDGSANASPSAAGSSSSAPGGTPKAEPCRTGDLELNATDTTIEGDPEGLATVQLTNGSGHSCSLTGFAGVDLKTADGPLPAERSDEKAGPVVLEDGASTAFGITYPVNTSGGSGVRVTGLVVTPPDETKSVTLPWPGGATLPVTEGGGVAVTVGPIGSAGRGGE